MGIFKTNKQALAAEVAAIILPQLQHQLSSMIPAKSVDLDKALEVALVKSVESAGASQEKTASILFGFMDRAADLAFRRSRQPGGKARALTAKRKKGQFARNCRLCQNPLLSSPSLDEITEHIKHRQDGESSQTFEVTDKAVIAHVDESELETAPDGRQQVECPDCQKGNPHEHGVN